MPRIDRQGVTDLSPQISPALRPPSESIFETAADQSSLSFASCFALIVNIGYMDVKENSYRLHLPIFIQQHSSTKQIL